MSDEKPDESGKIVLPKSLPLWATISAAVIVGGQIWGMAQLTASINHQFDTQKREIAEVRSYVDARLLQLADSDKRILDRSDERYLAVQTRLKILEQDRERMLQLFGKIDFILDAVKEMRQALDARAPAPTVRR